MTLRLFNKQWLLREVLFTHAGHIILTILRYIFQLISQ